MLTEPELRWSPFLSTRIEPGEESRLERLQKAGDGVAHCPLLVGNPNVCGWLLGKSSHDERAKFVLKFARTGLVPVLHWLADLEAVPAVASPEVHERAHRHQFQVLSVE